jgi:hypothetical protein
VLFMAMGQDSIFDLEIREKRAQAFLNKSKTGSRGGSKSRKGMRTPSDYMTKKERKELSGEVRAYNMNSLMDWKSFNEKTTEDKKTLLTHWRNIYKNTEIMTALSEGRGSQLNSQSFADLVNGLGIPKKARVNTGERKPKPRQAKTVAILEPEQKPLGEPMSLLQMAETFTQPKEIQTPQQPTQLITKGLHLEYNGVYDADTINKILTKLQLLVDGEQNKFNVSITLTEKTK